MRRFFPIAFAVTACTSGQVTLDAAHPLALSVGAEGGTIHADGVQIDVPAGAVAENVTITAYPKDRVVDGLATASQAWTFGPDGQTFKVPLTVHLKFTNLDADATVWWTKPGDHNTFTALETTVKDGWAIAQVTHFSEGLVGEDACGGRDDEDTDAREGDEDTGEREGAEGPEDTDARSDDHGGHGHGHEDERGRGGQDDTASESDTDARGGEHEGDEPHGTCEGAGQHSGHGSDDSDAPEGADTRGEPIDTAE